MAVEWEDISQLVPRRGLSARVEALGSSLSLPMHVCTASKRIASLMMAEAVWAGRVSEEALWLCSYREESKVRATATSTRRNSFSL